MSREWRDNNEVLYAAQWKNESFSMGFNEQKNVNIERWNASWTSGLWDTKFDFMISLKVSKRIRTKLLDRAETYAKYLRFIHENFEGYKGELLDWTSSS